jgi:hypothetical protein
MTKEEPNKIIEKEMYDIINVLKNDIRELKDEIEKIKTLLNLLWEDLEK